MRLFPMTTVASQSLWSKLSDSAVFIPTQFLVEGDSKSGYSISYVDAELCGFSLTPDNRLIRSFYAVNRLIEEINAIGTPKNYAAFVDMRSFGWANYPMPVQQPV